MLTMVEVLRSAFVMMLAVSSIVVAQQSSNAFISMHLVTPDAGWLSTAKTLYWSADGGRQWKDVTPPMAVSEQMSDVFFQNSASGWVLIAGPDAHVRVASSTTAGANWITAPVRTLDLDRQGMMLSGGGHIYFLDTMHGWMNLDLVGSSNFDFAALYETLDGGRTWGRAPAGPGVSGAIRFVSTTDGWAAGGPGNEHLYSTHDGSKTWHEVTVRTPVQVYPTASPNYQLPMFTDSKHGWLPVTYAGPEGTMSAVFLFATEDGGVSWIPQSKVSLDKQISPGSLVGTTVVEGKLITALPQDRTHITLKMATNTGEMAKRATVTHSAIFQLSFVDNHTGWALTFDKLFSTVDGGGTWTDITPRTKVTHFPASTTMVTAEALTYSESALSPAVIATAGPAGVHTSPHIGMDTCSAPAKSDMLTIWSTSPSPYYDAGIYIGGSNRSCSQPNLSSTWVTSTVGAGWGLMPIWVGPQAPCACDPNLPGTCPPFPSVFNSSTSTAKSQGVSEADKAVSAATSLGLSNTIIYYDLEPYSSTQCGSAATAFVSGWVSELHAKGYTAGIYGPPTNAQSDWSISSPLPDAVWISKWDNHAAIWNLTPLTDNAHWLKNQRIHQYINKQSIQYGSSSILTADIDIINAPVGGGNGSKTHTFTFQLYNESNTCGTAAQGISRNLDITGWYCNIGSPVGNYPTDSYLQKQSGSYSTFGCFSSETTEAYGINSQDQIVGLYTPNGTTANEHGFTYTNSTCTTIDFPGAGHTQAWGVNDVGQIAGVYADSAGNSHGFLDQNGTFTSINITGSSETVANGINGLRQVVGSYVDANGIRHGLFYDADGSYKAIDCTGASSTALYGINNNGQISGTCDGTGFVFDIPSQRFTFLTYPGATYTYLYGLNDRDYLVGGWGTSTSYFNGLLATPF